MAATVILQQLTGASPTATTVSASPWLYGTDDIYNPGATYPVLRPTSGTNYSYEATFRPSASGSFTSLSNWQFYSDGSNSMGTGRGVTVKAISSGSYAAATGTQGSTATVMGSGTSAFSYAFGASLALTGSISSAGSGTVQYVRHQGSVASTAATGNGDANESLYWQWDET